MKFWIALIIVGGVVLALSLFSTSAEACTAIEHGKGETKVVMVTQPGCKYCEQQAQILAGIEGELSYKLEEIDINCAQAKTGKFVQGTPAFIIGDKVEYGVKSAEELKALA
jgi:glutaredoxin